MRRTFASIIGIGAALIVATWAALAFATGEARNIGRTDPRRAANYRPPLFNFSETYTDGIALGVRVGSARRQAIQRAVQAGFIVEPSGWGDNRAGGAELYHPQALLRTMLRQPYLSFHDPRNVKQGIIVHFHDDRVSAVDVHYINFEAI